MITKKILSPLFGILLYFALISISLATQRSPAPRVESGSGGSGSGGSGMSDDETCRGRCNRFEQECHNGCLDNIIGQADNCNANTNLRIKKAIRTNNEVMADKALEIQSDCVINAVEKERECQNDCYYGGSECRDSCPD